MKQTLSITTTQLIALGGGGSTENKKAHAFEAHSEENFLEGEITKTQLFFLHSAHNWYINTGTNGRVKGSLANKRQSRFHSSLVSLSDQFHLRYSRYVFFLPLALQSFRVYTFLAFTVGCFSLNGHCN